MAEIFQAAATFSQTEFVVQAGGNGLAAATKKLGFDVLYSASHSTLNLHRCGHFQASCPLLCSKLVAAMHAYAGERWQPDMSLQIRCVELHTYVAGDGLMESDHRDSGSVLSLSCLLSEPGEHAGEEATYGIDFVGGEFVTHAEGQTLEHPMQRGDAVLFSSEMRHNVRPIIQGTRRSLVCELWERQTNETNRDS